MMKVIMNYNFKPKNKLHQELKHLKFNIQNWGQLIARSNWKQQFHLPRDAQEIGREKMALPICFSFMVSLASSIISSFIN